MRKFRLRQREQSSSNLQTTVTETSVQASPQHSFSPAGPPTATESQTRDATYVSSSQSEQQSLLKTSITTQTGAPFAFASPAKNKMLLSRKQKKRLGDNRHRVKKMLSRDPVIKPYVLASVVAETLREGESCKTMAEALSGYSNVREVLTAQNNKSHLRQLQTNQRITEHYVNMLMHRKSRQFAKAAKEAVLLKARYSLSRIGQTVGRSKSEISRLLNYTYRQPSRGTTDEQKQIVTDFIKNDSLVALAGRRFKNIRFMNRTYSRSYTSYRAHLVVSQSKTKPVGLTTYYNLLRNAQTTDTGRKMRIRPGCKIPWVDAQCLKCVNLKLCTKSLLANGVSVSNRTTVNLAASVCPFYIPRELFEELLRQNCTKTPVETPILPGPSGPTAQKSHKSSKSTKAKGRRRVAFEDQKNWTETDLPHKDPAGWVQINTTTLQHVPDLDLSALTKYASTKCLMRECPWCGVWMLQPIFKQHRSRRQHLVGLEYWGNERDDKNKNLVHPTRKKTMVCTLAFVWKQFLDLIGFCSSHLLLLKWQQEQFSTRLNNLLPGEVLTVQDYAMNIEVQEQENTSESHFNRHNFTVGVFVAFFKCSQGCDQLRKHDFIMLTSRHKKDQHSTFMMTKKYLEEIEKENMMDGKLTSLTEFCDNCAGQFKSRLSALYMTKLGIPVTRMFFAARHGKGIADAAIANFKGILYQYCKTGDARLRTEHDVVNFFQLYRKEKEASQHLNKVLFPNQRHTKSYCEHTDRSCHFVNASWIEALAAQNPLKEEPQMVGIMSSHAFRYDPNNNELRDDSEEEEREDRVDGKIQSVPVLEHKSLHCVCRCFQTHLDNFKFCLCHSRPTVTFPLFLLFFSGNVCREENQKTVQEPGGTNGKNTILKVDRPHPPPKNQSKERTANHPSKAVRQGAANRKLQKQKRQPTQPPNHQKKTPPHKDPNYGETKLQPQLHQKRFPNPGTHPGEPLQQQLLQTPRHKNPSHQNPQTQRPAPEAGIDSRRQK